MVLTRRAHKAHMIITRWLPNEIIGEIIQNTSKADQATLCRVSKVFFGLALPILNRDVRLSESHYIAAGAFCSSLIANAARADAIRSLSVVPNLAILEAMEAPPTPPNDFCDLLLKSMKLMRRLEHLTVVIFNGRMHTEFPRLLQSCTFPRLLTCEAAESHLCFEHAPEGDFLTRHPTLTRLSVVADALITGSRRPVSHLHWVKIPLPNIQYCDGPSDLFPQILTGDLKQARLRWFFEDAAAIERTMISLALSTSPDTMLDLSHEYAADICIKTHASYQDLPNVLVWRALGASRVLERYNNACRKVNGIWESCTAQEFEVQATLPESWAPSITVGALDVPFQVGQLTIPLACTHFAVRSVVLIRTLFYRHGRELGAPWDPCGSSLLPQRRTSKSLVVFITVAELLQTLGDSRDTITVFGAGWGKFDLLNEVGWAWFSVPILSPRSSWAPVYGPAWTYHPGRFSLIQFCLFHAPVVWLAATALSDLMIVAGTVFYVARARQPGFRQTQHMVSRIIKVTIETGVVCALFAIVDLLIFDKFEGNPAGRLHLAL
ncbi:hypothetical protein DFH07DRAFT_780887 [Mycena maculata]|uniref:DUF6534 domain-containing protein n=1 Tax=Mycena maculata TaxID=230809 RepID=A0AAD7I2I2_9AGAR|nr:hypothetical protein DFH07DRAFT_780887 [Mycena maculata]